jgi:hypothetical protein
MRVQALAIGGNGSNRKWIGTDGWVHVTRGAFSASNEAWTEMSVLPDDQRKVKLIESPGHMRTSSIA